MRIGRSILAVLAVLAGLLAIPAGASAAAPDLTITVQGFPDPIGPGADLSYVIDVANTGNATATNVTVSDEIPAGTTFSHATNPATWSLASGPASPTQTFTTAVLPAGGSAQFTITVTVFASAHAGTTITNTASISGTPTDPFPRDNSDTTTNKVQQPDLTVSIADNPDAVAPGHDLTYSIEVKNEGGLQSQAVDVSDTIPPGTTFSSISIDGSGWTVITPPAGGTGTVTFHGPPMIPGEYHPMTIVVHVDPGASDGATISDTASVTTASLETTEANNSATATTRVSTGPDLAVTNVSTPGPIDADSDLSYSLAVTNQGAFQADDVVLSFPLPAGTSYAAYDQPPVPGFSCAGLPVGGDGTFVCSRSSVQPGETVAVAVKVHVNPAAAGTTLESLASVSTASADTDTTNNSAASTTAVNPAASSPPPTREEPQPSPTGVADLFVVKPVKAAAVRHGRKSKLRLAIANRGKATAVGARLTVSLPGGVKLVSARGCKAKKRRVTCALGDVRAGGKAKRTLVLRAKRKGRFKLKARATSTGADARPADNVRSVVLRVR